VAAALGRGFPRRQLGALAAGVAATIGLSDAADAKKRKGKGKGKGKGKRKKAKTGSPPGGCTPDCSGKSCGGDGCGGTCGSCNGAEGRECANGRCTAYRLVTGWGSRGSEHGQFWGARGIAVDSTGHVYVADGFNDRVQKFTNDGEYVDQWGGAGDEPGQFDAPGGVAVDAADFVYVGDADNFRVQKLTPDGTPVTAWGERKEPDLPVEPGQFNSMSGVAASRSGVIYVVESSGPPQGVNAFSNTGSFLRRFGSFGTEEGQFHGPRGIAVDRAENIYVADSSNWRIQKFNSNGTFLSAWGSRGRGPGQFQELKGGLAIDAADHLYVADEVNKNIQKFDGDGNLVNVISGNFAGPHSVAVDRDGNVFVSDGDRILKFALGN
jgi:tripartite motif-containing protein 71